MRSVVALACAVASALQARAQTGLVSAQTGSAPIVVLRDVRIGAVYSEINGFTARLEAAFQPEDNAAWRQLSMRLEMQLADGVRREITLQCSDCRDKIYAYFESSPWEAGHVKGFAIRGVSGDYIADKELLAYRGWVARDADCFTQAEANREVPECTETTRGELAASVESNVRGVPEGAAMVVLTNGPGDSPETHFGLVPKRLLHRKMMRVVVHVDEIPGVG